METISLTRLRKERQLLSQMESKTVKIDFAEDNRSLEVEFLHHSIPVIYYIILPERYPFLPPKITSNIPPSLSCLFSESSNLLEFILEDSWTPALNLQVLIERLHLFSDKSLTQISPNSLGRIGIIGAALIAIFLRFAMFTQEFSGYNDPPVYGDYEAHRHWMELTVNLPAEFWYKDNEQTDPSYWRLDYPPLSAWHSYIFGLISSIVEPDSMVLSTSRGYYTTTHMIFMRMSVLISDILIYLPSVILFFFYTHSKINSRISTTALLLFLMSPPLLLIDYGHFQYNNIILGFALYSIILTINGNYSIASVSLALSLNFKITSSFYTLPLLLAWLVSLYEQSYRESFKYSENMRTAIKTINSITGFVNVLGSGFLVFLIIWSPWLNGEDFGDVFAKSFSVYPNFFKENVANFWSITSKIVDYEIIFTGTSLTAITGLVTILTSAPFLFYAFRKRNIKNSVIYGAAGVALSFFLFSSHVDAKTILVPLMPISIAFIFSNPDLFELAIVTGSFSIYPLLVKDNLRIPYGLLQLLFLALSRIHINNLQSWIKAKYNLKWYFGISLIHMSEFLGPPQMYPDFFSYAIATLSFVCFCFIWISLLKELKCMQDGDGSLGYIKKHKVI